MVAPAQLPCVSWCQGDGPVVLVCGHDGAIAPPGHVVRSSDDAVIVRDLWTRDITLGVASKIESPSIVMCEVSRKYIDVNRMPKWAYETEEMRDVYVEFHRKVAKVVANVKARHSHGLLLDIHGTSIAAADVYLGTVYHYSVRTLTPVRSLSARLRSRGYRVAWNHPRLIGGFIVKLHGDMTGGIDAIQVEIGKHIRASAEHRQRFIDDFADVINGWTKRGRSPAGHVESEGGVDSPLSFIRSPR